MEKVDKPVAIVTASSSGIGATIAKTLHDRGYSLALFASSERVESVAKPFDALAVRGSLDRREDLERLTDATLERYGRIDALVNNSARPTSGDVLSISDSDWLFEFQMQFMNAVRMTQLVLPQLRTRKGSIVNISAYTAREPDQRYVVGGVMRAALLNFMKLAAEKEAPSGVRINNLLVGFVDNYPEIESIVSAIPMGRYARIAEIANTVAFLLSADAGYITGTSIAIDGGLSRAV
ncbi:SDR family oxidoreductase [Mesorhizobium retamae]|uniref:SDR family oxidoreductase n=1 Tax=Mesorhizobium retamae TaxID=2912854 RepID=A0ABS9QDC2_9HYPH|nr:SDR family oxidoreductase [Mesorhizobium sp. IRAMC:0171]